MRGSAHTNSINIKEDGMSTEKNVMSDAVANVMTRDLHCVTPETSIMNAALRMRLADVGAVLVDGGRVSLRHSDGSGHRCTGDRIGAKPGYDPGWRHLQP